MGGAESNSFLTVIFLDIHSIFTRPVFIPSFCIHQKVCDPVGHTKRVYYCLFNNVEKFTLSSAVIHYILTSTIGRDGDKGGVIYSSYHVYIICRRWIVYELFYKFHIKKVFSTI